MSPHTTRITIRPDQLGGAPCIRGLRIPVSVVVEMVTQGMSDEEILELYPDLEREDIGAAVGFVGREAFGRSLNGSGP